MPDTQKEFDAAFKILATVEAEMAKGISLEDACAQLDLDTHDVQSFADRIELPENRTEVMEACHVRNAAFPIFVEKDSSSFLEQVGSGVLVEIGSELFALTAAHVLDLGDGAHFMPAAEGIEQMTGGFSAITIPESGNRKDDKGDMGYCRLEKNWQTKLHSSITPLSVSDLMLTDDVSTGDVFTFIGYPWRKTKSRGRIHETDRTTYSGHAAAPDIYERLNYDRRVHVVIRMRRRKSYSTRYESYQTAPHPQGISGGPVVAWPTSFGERRDSSNLKLAAIGHTYHGCEHFMAATRIISLVMAIVRNNPGLAIHFDGLRMCDELASFLTEYRT